jgi:O-antigen/teichoic acid export membrane protein
MVESGNKRIAKNAAMLYVRMIANILIGLFYSRLVLEALGVNDYGIFNLVGGVIVLANTITTSFASGTSRYITYSLGTHNAINQKTTFNTALVLHILITFVFLIIAETVGLWFVNTQLVIDSGRMIAANWVYQTSVIVTALGVTQAPYSALITSYERFDIYAYIEIAVSLLKLAIAIILLYVDTDKLILYSILYSILSICTQLFYRIFCAKHFMETSGKIVCDKYLMKDMLSFTGWNFIRQSSLTFSSQGNNILLNWFFGTAMNAAAGIATQVQGILYAFIGNVTKAFEPQIIKNYAIKEYNRVNTLICNGSLFASLTTLIISIPIILKMRFLMGIWLKTVPDAAVTICQILLIQNFFNSFSPLVSCGIQATKQVKMPNILSSIVYIALPFLLYAILYVTSSYQLMYWALTLSIVIPLGIFLVYFKKSCSEFDVKRYILKTIIPVVFVGGISLLVCSLVESILLPELISLVLLSVCSCLCVCIPTYCFILDRPTKHRVNNYISSVIQKLR